MKEFIQQFADAAAAINQVIGPHKNFRPGIGPYGEDEIVQLIMDRIGTAFPGYHIRPDARAKRNLGLEHYCGISRRPATPDLVLPGVIAEFKIARPVRDNGDIEDTWFKKCFEPFPESYSTFIDVAKLCRFHDQHDPANRFEKWVIVIGFERENEPVYKLDTLFPSLFTYISESIVQRPVKDFLTETRSLGPRHPYHQVLKLYAFRY